MKLFRTVDKKEVVYVQMQDIMYLANETNMPIPATIFEKVFKGVTIVTDENRFDFVKFEDESDVKFFKKLDFIIDFDKFKDLTDDQLDAELESIVEKANELAIMHNNMPENMREKHPHFWEEHKKVTYMLLCLLDYSNGEWKIPLQDIC